MGDVVPRAELVEQSRAVDAVSGLETALGIVDAGVNHLAVAGTGAAARASLALQNADAASAVRDGQRGRQTHHSCTDDCYIDVFHECVRCHGWITMRRCPRRCVTPVYQPRPLPSTSRRESESLNEPQSGPVTSSNPITRVLITGAHGQLGAAMVHAFAGLEVTAHTRSTLDVTDAAAVSRAVDGTSPHLIVNCAAFNDVDGAEDRAVEALAVNAFAVRNLARAAEDAGARFVHYSTDFVFDGSADDARTPRTCARHRAAPTRRRSCWANGLRSRRRSAYVLRVESLFGAPANWTGRRGTLDGIVANLEQGREVRAFTDRIVSPGYVVDIAAATQAPGDVER